MAPFNPEYVPRTQAERIQNLQQQRDEIEDELSQPDEYWIGDRRVRRDQLVQKLAWIEERLAAVQGVASGHARNRTLMVRGW